MATNTYDKGDLVRCTGTFTDGDGTNVDPSAVYFQVKNPVGTITKYTYGTDAWPVRSATGIYYADIDASIVGEWWYRIYSTGTDQAADEDNFIVKETHF